MENSAVCQLIAFSLSTPTFSLSTPVDNSEATLRSLLNELAHLTIVTIVKQASSFNRDLRVIVCLLEPRLDAAFYGMTPSTDQHSLPYSVCSIFVKTGIFYQKYFYPIMTILLRLFQIAYRSFLALVKGVEGLGTL